jgi:hypothetical protein
MSHFFCTVNKPTHYRDGALSCKSWLVVRAMLLACLYNNASLVLEDEHEWVLYSLRIIGSPTRLFAYEVNLATQRLALIRFV